jgi:ABC-type uncharacterized transport system auxiliary subunit
LVTPDFGAPQPPVKAAWSLAVMRPDIAGGLNTQRIALIQADATMDYYADAQYPDLVPGLVQDALLNGLRTSGHADQVSREQDALHADYDLFVTVKDFQARYSAPGQAPEVQVTLVTQLATAHGRRILASFTASQHAPAGADSAAAAAAALSVALGAAARDVTTWALATIPATPPQP